MNFKATDTTQSIKLLEYHANLKVSLDWYWQSNRTSPLVREAVQDWVKKHLKPGWPAAVLDFKGIKDFTPFEEYRKDFSAKDEDPFA